MCLGLHPPILIHPITPRTLKKPPKCTQPPLQLQLIPRIKPNPPNQRQRRPDTSPPTQSHPTAQNGRYHMHIHPSIYPSARTHHSPTRSLFVRHCMHTKPTAQTTHTFKFSPPVASRRPRLASPPSDSGSQAGRQAGRQAGSGGWRGANERASTHRTRREVRDVMRRDETMENGAIRYLLTYMEPGTGTHLASRVLPGAVGWWSPAAAADAGPDDLPIIALSLGALVLCWITVAE
ncbi:hypothetical protein IWZ03DRAFT_244316 [Phyllosticta citriasiana]|uniref:Uncharacterized protein n=1 Tax=Phyllosticta citriasiana TaxID=595635 RepID=A0ABR1KFT5_9PEZI